MTAHVALLSPNDGTTIQHLPHRVAADDISSCTRAGYPIHEYYVRSPTGRLLTLVQVVTTRSSLIYLTEEQQ